MYRYFGGLKMICEKCGLHETLQDTSPLCLICFYKKAGWWAKVESAIHSTYHNGLRDLHPTKYSMDTYGCTHSVFKYEGWSVITAYSYCKAFIAVLKCSSLNNTPKTTKTIADYFSAYWINKFEGVGK
jgi:hypothetical protein